jgi:hypothetical protein
MSSTSLGPKAFAIVPSDTVNQAIQFKAIYVGGAGNINLVNQDGTTVLFTAVPVGSTLNVAGKRVNLTNTTATLMVGIS